MLKFECDRCRAKFKSEDEIVEHKKTSGHQSSNQSFTCDACSKLAWN